MQQPNIAKSEKEFKQTEIGLIPEEWEVVKLGDVFEIQQGKALSPKSKKGISPRPFIRTSNVLWGRIDLSHIDYMDFDKKEIQKYALKENDLLVCEGGEIGRTAIWKNIEGIYCYQNHLHRLRPKIQNISPLFTMYWMQAAFLLLNVYLGAGNVTTIPNLSRSRLSNFLIPLPPLPEQKKIAYVLSVIQEAKEKTEAVIRASKELKRSLMKYLFTYGPVPFTEAENVKLKETEIGLIPEEWEVVKLGDVAEFKNGINFKAEEKGIKGILTVDVLNMYGDNIYINTHNLYRVNKSVNKDYLLKNEDILFVRSSLKQEGVGWASLFKEIDEPVTFCGFIIRARLQRDNIYPEYLVSYLRTPIARSNLVSASGKVAITNINQGSLKKLAFSLPPLHIQQKIASILSAVDEKIEKEEDKKKALEELFKSMLHNLMTGKVRVKDLDIEVKGGEE